MAGGGASGKVLLRRLLIRLLVAPIRFYQLFISPFFPPACRFQPTCSQYAIEAFRVHGPLKGGYLAIRRILRCHPITWLGGSSGYDPVPPATPPAAGQVENAALLPDSSPRRLSYPRRQSYTLSCLFRRVPANRCPSRRLRSKRFR